METFVPFVLALLFLGILISRMPFLKRAWALPDSISASSGITRLNKFNIY
jgi:hypothetical protein